MAGSVAKSWRPRVKEFQGIINLTRERQFVHFWHLRVDSFDHFQTLPDYRGRHLHQKIGNIYGHFAQMDIQYLKNCQNFKTYENFKGVAET